MTNDKQQFGLGMVVCFALSMAGCAPAVRPAVAVTSLPPKFEARATAGPVAAALPGEAWWRDFADPQLNSLVEQALTRSTTIRLAQARIREARALRSQSRAATLPSGSVSASGTRQDSAILWGGALAQDRTDSAQITFSPAWEIDLFGRLDAQRDRADSDAAAAAFDFAASRLSLAADTASALFQARLIAAQLETARGNLEISRQLARTARLGFERGLTSGQDLARLDSDAASGAAEVERLATELGIAKRSLLILVGDPAGATEALAIEPDLAPPPMLPDAAPSILLVRRPDVRSAAQSLLSANLTTRVDRLALFPRLSLQPAGGVSASSSAGGIGTGFWSLGANLAVPVLDRARLLAAMRVSEARAEQAAIRYEKAVQTAFGEAENTLARAHSGHRRAAELEDALTNAAGALDRARKGYRAGLTDLTTLLQVQRTWLQARNARDAGRAALLTDSVAAIRALGGGWSPEASTKADLIDPATPGPKD